VKGLRTMTAPMVQADTSAWSAEEERMLELCYSAFTIKTLARVWPSVAGKSRSRVSIQRKAEREYAGVVPSDVWDLCDE